MADVILTVYDTDRDAGVNVTDNDTAVTSSDVFFFPNNGNVRLLITDTSTSNNNVTITTPGSVDGNAIADLVVTCPGSEQLVLGPFPPSVYNNSSGQVRFTVAGNANAIAVRG